MHQISLTQIVVGVWDGCSRWSWRARKHHASTKVTKENFCVPELVICRGNIYRVYKKNIMGKAIPGPEFPIDVSWQYNKPVTVVGGMFWLSASLLGKDYGNESWQVMVKFEKSKLNLICESYWNFRIAWRFVWADLESTYTESKEQIIRVLLLSNPMFLT